MEKIYQPSCEVENLEMHLMTTDVNLISHITKAKIRIQI